MSPNLLSNRLSSLIPLDGGGVKGRTTGVLRSSLGTEPLLIPSCDDAEDELEIALGVEPVNNGVPFAPSRWLPCSASSDMVPSEDLVSN